MSKPSARKVVGMHIPRCPMCDARLEEVQLRKGEIPGHEPMVGWMETWGCDSCHTNHTFPARIEFLQRVANSQMLEKSKFALHLPK